MTNTILLREKIESVGIKYGFIAEKMGISHQSLLRKIENQTEFKASEIQKLCELLSIEKHEEKEDIFFV